ncbi:penicillin-binding protein 1B [Sansalvadorimonas sp. 2012CJ34-2]|uniref:Penicillin-binding protein 1B n=1 Tax=Parendozoicomonas callyspongiae TaxID=2942213 RepID=A0ABT0PK59_9GAMM|nr:penicillin-binding protein 1B [Sansalvadorimonas sp. 2012CJ34-2]
MSKTKTAQGKKRRRSPKKAGVRALLPSGKLLLKLCFCGLVVLAAWMIYLDSVITTTFDGKKWAIPAKVYARPVELYEGLVFAPDTLQAQLRRQGYQPVERISRPGTFSRSGNTFEIFTRSFQFPDGPQKSRKIRAAFKGRELTNLTTISGREVAVTRLEPQIMGGIYPASYEDRVLVRLKDVPKPLVKGLVAVEDRDFYRHWGISLKGIARAMVVNIKAGGIVQGGSTLTQQLVKNFYLNNKRTFSRKIEEALMSLLLELHYSKEDILETYMNEVYLGQQGQRSVHGFALASQFYFARPLQELDLSRQALLVAIVKGPSYYNPRRYPERTKERRDLVLDMMAENGIAPQAEVNRAKRRGLGVVSKERLQANAFPAYIDLVKRQLRSDYREADLTSEGLRIFTSMDPIIQQQAQASLENTTRKLDSGKDTGLEAAMVVTDARTGDVQAIVGGRDAGFAGFNRALDASRPIGSLVKPAVYMTALENPSRYTLTTLIEDSSITLTERNGREWSPQNYDKKSHGKVPLYMALAKSYNQATAHLGMDAGLPSVVSTLKSMGMTRSIIPYPSLLLGALDLSPVEVAAMYQTLASGGFRMPLRAIDTVQDAYGQPLRHYSLSVEKAFPEDQIALIDFALQKTMRQGTGASAYKTLPSSIRVAGKTGTTDDRRDSWFAGYSRDTLAVVWMGNDDNSPTRFSGSTGALRVWTDFMKKRPLQSLRVPQTENIVFYSIDRKTGLLGGDGCTDVSSIPFIKGSEPVQTAPCVKQPSSKGVVDWFKALWD